MRPGPLERGKFSPLTRRILALNMLPLALLAGGFTFLAQYEDALIDGELAAMRVQGEIVAAGLGESVVLGAEEADQRIEPEAARQLLVRLVQPTGVRARLFLDSGEMVADTYTLPGITPGRIQVTELPPPDQRNYFEWFDNAVHWVGNMLSLRSAYPPYNEAMVQLARDYQEAMEALRGNKASAVRSDRGQRLILSVAVPVQRYKQVLGALMVSHDDSTIAASVREVQLDVLRIAAVALAATVLLSLYLGGTIVRPLRRLAAAAASVRSNDDDKPEIPDLTDRRDEIGDLSHALRDMTDAIWKRMDAIESFAADVAHELKNPLTSLRSAVETTLRLENPEQRAKLLQIVLDDVNRLNRLISDISEASRLDASLMRAQMVPVDLAVLLQEMVSVYRATQADRAGVNLLFSAIGQVPFIVGGQESRLSQVFRNLLDNALSFSPADGKIFVTVQRQFDFVVASFEDEGAGIPENKRRAIFDRFYSERPAGEQFGAHSGLGLSIAKQIIEAYRGTIEATNRRDPSGKILGATFTVKLPAA